MTTDFEKQIGFEMHEATGNPITPCQSCEKLKEQLRDYRIAKNETLSSQITDLQAENAELKDKLDRIQGILERTLKRAKGEG